MINLKQFCADPNAERWRSDIYEPFSAGGFTYATNGCIAVRVAAQPEYIVAGEAMAKKIETLCKAFDTASAQGVTPFSALLPDPQPMVECNECGGEGHSDHDCPTCECSCEFCDGLGKVEQRRRIRFEGFDVDEKYLRLMTTLPALAIGSPPTSADPVLFHFDGGVGLFMPMSKSILHHNEVVLMAADLPASLEHAEKSE